MVARLRGVCVGCHCNSQRAVCCLASCMPLAKLEPTKLSVCCVCVCFCCACFVYSLYVDTKVRLPITYKLSACVYRIAEIIARSLPPALNKRHTKCVYKRPRELRGRVIANSIIKTQVTPTTMMHIRRGAAAHLVYIKPTRIRSLFNYLPLDGALHCNTSSHALFTCVRPWRAR